MKKSKLAKITIILAIILVVLISFGGIYVQNQTNMENKVSKFTFGEELDGYRQIIFSTKDENITPENVIKSKEMMENRLKDIHPGAYKIFENTENGNIVLQVAKDSEADYITTTLVQKGKLEIVDTDTKEVLLDSSNLSKAYTTYQTTTAGTIIYMAIEFDEEGTEKLKNISEKYVLVEADKTENEQDEHSHDEAEESEEESSEEKAPTVSLNLDGNTIISTGFKEPVTNGIINVAIGSAVTDQETFLTYVKGSVQYTTAIQNGVMPISYYASTNTYISSNIMENDLAKACLIIAAITVIALMVLVIKYKKMGLISAIAYLGCIAAYLLAIRYTDVIITLNSICGIIVILIINYIFAVKIAKNIKIDDSIAIQKDMFKKQILEFIMLLIPITVLTVTCAFTQLSSLGIAMFWGIVIMLVYNFIVTKFLVINNN